MITSQIIAPFTLKDLSEVYSNFSTIPELYKPLYETRQSQRPYEIVYEAATLPNGAPKPEGAPTTSQNFGPVFRTQFNHKVYTSRFDMTREAWDDNLYQEDYPQKNKNLRESLEQVNNINGMVPFNQGFNIAFRLADTEPLYSTAHPTSTGTFANTFPSPVGFNEATLTAAYSIIRYWVNYSNQPLNRIPEYMLIPPTLEMSVRRVLQSPDDPSTANRAINPIYSANLVPGGFFSNPYLVNPDYWGLMTDQKPGAIWYIRDNFEMTWQGDNTVDTVTFVGRVRYSNGIVDPRYSFGAR